MKRRYGPGFVDLHCHWVPSIDDGARSVSEGARMLQALYDLGFDHVVATPHLRPGRFAHSPEEMRLAYRSACAELRTHTAPMPSVSLGSEHFFLPEVVDRLLAGDGLPYRPDDLAAQEKIRAGGAFLVEFHDLSPLPLIERQLFRLSTRGYLPVLAHPERYPAVWRNPEIVARLQAAGCVALLDVCAIVGKYGRQPQSTAQRLLEGGVYHAACSDSHRPADVELTARAMGRIVKEYGDEELEVLFKHGPNELLAGRRPTTM